MHVVSLSSLFKYFEQSFYYFNTMVGVFPETSQNFYTISDTKAVKHINLIAKKPQFIKIYKKGHITYQGSYFYERRESYTSLKAVFMCEWNRLIGLCGFPHKNRFHKVSANSWHDSLNHEILGFVLNFWFKEMVYVRCHTHVWAMESSNFYVDWALFFFMRNTLFHIYLGKPVS